MMIKFVPLLIVGCLLSICEAGDYYYQPEYIHPNVNYGHDANEYSKTYGDGNKNYGAYENAHANHQYGM
jgi:hypothetical protein